MPIRTAREAFIANPAKENFGRLADTAAFDVACEYALLAYIEEMVPQMDPNAAWTSHAKMVGAREVLAVLRTLHVAQQVKPAYRPPTLTSPK